MQVTHRSPNYFVRRRLLQNKPAMAGLFFIGIMVFVSLFGFLLMPDATPNANDGAVQIQKQLPGFSVQLLKLRKNVPEENENWLSFLFSGEKSSYLLVPADHIEVAGMQVLVDVFGGREARKSYPLPEVVLPLFVGELQQSPFPSGENYRIEENSIRYLDLAGQLQEISKEALTERFWDNNVENRHYWLGTDKSGRDLLSRLMYGARISLSIGFVSVLISLVIGVSIGALGGFFGGWVDAFCLWLMSVVWSIPGIMLVIAISLALQSRGVWVAFIAVGLTMWVDVARVVRGQVMSLKEKTYVEAARAFGISNLKIIYSHILPNMLGALFVIATANFASAILLEAGLSFLGLSVQPPTPSWGIMIYEGYHSLGAPNSWHLIAFPALAISGMVLSFNLLGNGLRDAYDPKTLL